MTEYVKISKDEYDKLKEIERNHRYLLSGELSYSNSVKNDKQKLQDKIDKVIAHCNKNIELWKNDFDMIDIYQEVLERLGYMKLEVGMYARFDGRIGKVKSICTCEQCKNRGYYEPTIEYAQGEIDYISCYWKDNLKASFNLIDLIEVGDYVNGQEVLLVKEDNKLRVVYVIKYIETSESYFTNDKIKSILTHEQYEANVYKVSK